MHLFAPLKIKGILFKNRAVFAPIVLNFGGEDGSVNSNIEEFYLPRAKASVGFIILGATYVHKDGKGFIRQLGIHTDGLLQRLADLVQSLKKYTRIGIQLSFKSIGRLPEDFKLREIESYRKSFVKAARRAQDCGFDAIELHACHDYWLNFFLSPHFNHRKDDFGGSFENRFRLLKETIQSIRSEVGDTLILGVRLSMNEYVEDGLRLPETLDVGRQLQDIGVDYISASSGIGKTHHRISPPMEIERGASLPLAKALKNAVSIPIIGVGRLDRPAIFKEAVSSGTADFVAVARALISDPEYVLKIQEGRETEIRPCIACNFCLGCLQRNEEVRCAVNPYIGRDSIKLEPLKQAQRILVIGGGPAGLIAAATAAKRGARVKLIEKKPFLGGKLNIAKIPPFKDNLQDLIDYLVNETMRNGVEIQTGQLVDPKTIKDESPDGVVFAAGGIPLIPEIPGIGNHRVLTPDELLILDKLPHGNYLIVGAGAVGLEVAEYLVEAKADTTIIEMTDEVGRDLHSTRLNLILDQLARARVEPLTNTKLVSLNNKMAHVETPNGLNKLGPYDYFVLSTGYRGNRELLESLELEAQVTVIGDAKEPRSIFEAIQEGFEAALKLVP